MNKELGLPSVTRRHKPGYRKGTAHKVFENLLNQNFTVNYSDKIWCTDFRHYRVIPMVQLRSRIFRQTIQKFAGCSSATGKDFCEV